MLGGFYASPTGGQVYGGEGGLGSDFRPARNIHGSDIAASKNSLNRSLGGVCGGKTAILSFIRAIATR